MKLSRELLPIYTVCGAFLCYAVHILLQGEKISTMMETVEHKQFRPSGLL